MDEDEEEEEGKGGGGGGEGERRGRRIGWGRRSSYAPMNESK